MQGVITIIQCQDTNNTHNSQMPSYNNGNPIPIKQFMFSYYALNQCHSVDCVSFSPLLFCFFNENRVGELSLGKINRVLFRIVRKCDIEKLFGTKLQTYGLDKE